MSSIAAEVTCIQDWKNAKREAPAHGSKNGKKVAFRKAILGNYINKSNTKLHVNNVRSTHNEWGTKHQAHIVQWSHCVIPPVALNG